jgi:hypothetical protein
MTRPVPSSALPHLRVLDLTHLRAGPTCCRILAEFGAEVIKIEAPRGVDPNEVSADRSAAIPTMRSHVSAIAKSHEIAIDLGLGGRPTLMTSGSRLLSRLGGHVGEPGEIAMIAFLASPKSAYTIVATLDAGVSLRPGAV